MFELILTQKIEKCNFKKSLDINCIKDELLQSHPLGFWVLCKTLLIKKANKLMIKRTEKV